MLFLRLTFSLDITLQGRNVKSIINNRKHHLCAIASPFFFFYTFLHHCHYWATTTRTRDHAGPGQHLMISPVRIPPAKLTDTFDCTQIYCTQRERERVEHGRSKWQIISLANALSYINQCRKGSSYPIYFLLLFKEKTNSSIQKDSACWSNDKRFQVTHEILS